MITPHYFKKYSIYFILSTKQIKIWYLNSRSDRQSGSGWVTFYSYHKNHFTQKSVIVNVTAITIDRHKYPCTQGEDDRALCLADSSHSCRFHWSLEQETAMFNILIGNGKPVENSTGILLYVTWRLTTVTAPCRLKYESVETDLTTPVTQGDWLYVNRPQIT